MPGIPPPLRLGLFICPSFRAHAFIMSRIGRLFQGLRHVRRLGACSQRRFFGGVGSDLVGIFSLFLVIEL